MSDIGAKWEELVGEWDAANERFLDSFTAVIPYLKDVAKSSAADNPPIEAMQEQQNAWTELEDISRRMDEFVKQNAKH